MRALPHPLSSPLLLALALSCALSCVLSCTSVDLVPVEREPPTRDDRVSVGGGLCTRTPTTSVTPLRVLFVVDASDSMEVTDPPDPVTLEAGRQRAVRETWEQLLVGDPEGVRVGVIRFASEAQASTPIDEDGDGLADTYFTADRAILASATDRLGLTGRATNYATALAEAYLELRTEYTRADDESLPLSRYVVIFLSDGLPDGDRGNSLEDATDGVQELIDLARIFRVGRFEFHTAYLSAGRGPDLDREAQELLQQMADTGGGSFRSFPSGESINFLFVELTSVRSVFSIDQLSIINLNAVVDISQMRALPYLPANLLSIPGGDGGVLADGAVGADAAVDGGGGLDGGALDGGALDGGGADGGDAGPAAPDLERAFADRDGDGFPGCGEPVADSDADGLVDLLEMEIGTDPLLADTDDDGLRDLIEWRIADLDPLDPTDARCLILEDCRDEDGDMQCDCLADANLDGVCDCEERPTLMCVDDAGHDCVDTDMDGVCDCPDADMDGFCDYPDRDGDLLNDCEEQFSGTRQLGFDSEPDGIPDLLEVLRRGDPVDVDRLFDGDWDESNNEVELLSGTDLFCDESAIRSRVAYLQDLETLETVDGRTCYTFEVRNVPLLPTMPNPDAAWPGNGWNRLLVYAAETSFDEPDDFGRFRLACVMVRYEPDGNYKNPPSGRVRLADEDFVNAEEFDPDVHCIWP